MSWTNAAKGERGRFESFANFQLAARFAGISPASKIGLPWNSATTDSTSKEIHHEIHARRETGARNRTRTGELITFAVAISRLWLRTAHNLYDQLRSRHTTDQCGSELDGLHDLCPSELVYDGCHGCSALERRRYRHGYRGLPGN